jgi:hypothetical protein
LFPAKPAKTSGVIIELNGTLKNAGSKPARNCIGMAQAIRGYFTRWFDSSISAPEFKSFPRVPSSTLGKTTTAETNK